MFVALAALIDRHPWRLLAATVAAVAVAAPLGTGVREHLKPGGFGVPGSGSAKARELIAQASGSDPANSVLALVRLPGVYGEPSARRTVEGVTANPRRSGSYRN